MVADEVLIQRLDELVALFNRRSVDLADGLDRRTQFLLNGTAFEAMLGRAPDNPLVLIRDRARRAVDLRSRPSSALPDARVQRGDIEDAVADGGSRCPSGCRGAGRGQAEPVETVARARPLTVAGAVTRADLAIDPGVVDVLREARLATDDALSPG